MSSIEIEVRPGAYYDSVVLMQLQRALSELDGVLDAGAVMGTSANLAMLQQSALLPPQALNAEPDDLVVAVRGEDAQAARRALAEVDHLLSVRTSRDREGEFLPQSLATAMRVVPEAQWVLVSVPGRYAARVAREALELDRHVFLYSDNVPIEEEISLKELASKRGRLLLGPDCGTAIINGVGFGFANHVRQGTIGIVAASGTGLQAVSAAIHRLGEGITHAIGTGGRDLSIQVGARTAHAALKLLSTDANTRVIVLISKPPAPEVVEALLESARDAGKPIVVNFVGYYPPYARQDNIYFARTFDEAASLAVELATDMVVEDTRAAMPFAPGQRFLRALFSGGTLAYETLLILAAHLSAVYSNTPLDKKLALTNPFESQAHSVIDLGADDFTVGRLHPMMDNELRIRRLRQEASDPEVALLLLDIVLGYGAHPDPAGELAPVIEEVKSLAARQGRHLEVVAMVIGTDGDPQGLDSQIQQLQEAGAWVSTSSEEAARYAAEITRTLQPASGTEARGTFFPSLQSPVVAINIGLTSFSESLRAQGASVTQVSWRPPAGGNEQLIGILDRMKGRAARYE